MVIFGKKAKALLKRVEELELTKELQGKENMAVCEKLDKLESMLKELTMTVENNFEDGNPKKTPQQLLREWFLGKEDNE